MSKKRPSLGLVAELSGVSPSTVSRILNNTAKVSDSKKKTVLRVIEETGFRPNLAARTLAGGRAMSIGVLTQYIDSPFYGEAIRGIEEVLASEDYTALFASGRGDRELELERLNMLMERNIDGLIVLSSTLEDHELEALAKELPVVLTGRATLNQKLTSIGFDNLGGGGLALGHLAELGHEAIAVIDGPDDPDAKLRMDGIRVECSQRRIDLDPELIEVGDFNELGGYQAMVRLLDKPKDFSAVIALNDQMAYGAMLALSEAGLDIPGDISLLGFDDLPHSAYTVPPLTTISQPVNRIGAMAASTVLAMSAGFAQTSDQSVAASIVVRKSTDSPKTHG
ncbi:MAG: LacI family transcriptional regulator [Oceanospirillales bacterium TMED33]|nr:transcriptional regulator [Gammaproteobacteria bacterium]RPG19761.1 MAG: LacI family transcriptional regulator [Oceanospirillales bacterium TMED33]